MELWTLCRKPIEGTIAQNVVQWGTGGINIDGCRVEFVSEEDKGNPLRFQTNNGSGSHGVFNASKDVTSVVGEKGRFPANVIHDGSDEVVKLFPDTNPTKPRDGDGKKLDTQNMGWGFKRMGSTLEDNGGSASRFFKQCNYDEIDGQRIFYTPKASQQERNAGLYGFEEEEIRGGGVKAKKKNIHPTVKPLSLMLYLCRLITPKGGLVLDPFLGSGSTAVAAKLEGFNYIGIELDEKYVAISEARIKNCERDNKTIKKMLTNDDVTEVFDIFDFMGEVERKV
jgi:site-specific DNA-methyltransferase (adenine-specific)